MRDIQMRACRLHLKNEIFYLKYFISESIIFVTKASAKGGKPLLSLTLVLYHFFSGGKSNVICR